jgi:hypothetical protein
VQPSEERTAGFADPIGDDRAIGEFQVERGTDEVREAMAAGRTVRLPGLNLPAASPFVNPDSAHHRPRREAGRGINHSP